MVIVIFGVSGAGKTTVGRLLAERVGWKFFDADDFHPPENKDKMSRGIPLNDDDRKGWLDALRAEISETLSDGTDAVLACSALKKSYREKLSVSGEVKFVYLKGSFEQISDRISRREDHFMNPGLLQSQFDTLEEPDSDDWTFDVAGSPEEIAEKIFEKVTGDK